MENILQSMNYIYSRMDALGPAIFLSLYRVSACIITIGKFIIAASVLCNYGHEL